METDRALDQSAWDANRAMGQCSSAADYRSICAGEATTGEPDQRQHWKLPHHYLGKDANASGVRAARQRFAQTQGLTDREKARTHLFETHKLPSDEGSASRPPRDGIVRATTGSIELRSVDGDPREHMVGHFAPFDEWTEIDSLVEGRFMEQFVRGSFTKTFSDHTPKVLFQHGMDPALHNKPIGIPEVLREEELGAYYDVPLFAGLPELFMEGLRSDPPAYGASFRFRVMREEIDEEPERSDHNPDGLPERTVKEADVMEFGPVTFPAYAGATAGVRSMTDEFVFADFASDPKRLVDLIEHIRATRSEERPQDHAPSDAGHPPTSERRVPLFGQDEDKEAPAWLL